MRRFLIVLLAACTLSATGLPAGTGTAVADPGIESQIVGLLNGYRSANGLPPLEVSGELVGKARSWSATMAANGGISHSNLGSGIGTAWVRLGENVGRGASVDAIHNAWTRSPTHNANLLDPGFRLVGVGVFVDAGGGLWATQVFMEPASQPAPSPAPATGTPPSPPPPPPSGDAAPTGTSSPPPAPAPADDEVDDAAPPAAAPTQLTATLERLRHLER